MPLFKISDSKLKPLDARSFRLEIDLQKLVDKNLKELFGLDFIRTEFGGQGLFIDTIAYDPETSAPVLIEYKRDQQDTVVDQGLSYLRWLLEHKGDYQMELLEKTGQKKIDFSQSKVVFIARSFNKFHIQAAGYKDLPIELWEYEWYGDYLYLSKVNVTKSNTSITSVVKTQEAKSISRQIRMFSVGDHLNNRPEKIKALFHQINEGMKTIAPDFELHPVKSYVGYYKGGYNLIELYFYNNKITVGLLRVRPSDLQDPEKRMRYVTISMQSYNKHISTVDVKGLPDVEYTLMLIRQLYSKFKGKIGNW